MENLGFWNLICNLAIFILTSSALLFRKHLFSYMSKKGENLATTEDIAGITHQIEGVKTEYAKDMAKFRTELERGAFIEQIKYRGVYQQQARVLAEIYSLAYIAKQEAVHYTQVGDVLNKEPTLWKTALAARNALQRYYDKNRLYLSDKTEKSVENASHELNHLIGDFRKKELNMNKDQTKPPTNRSDDPFLNADDMVSGKVEPALRDLKDEFRRILGVNIT